MSSGVLPILCPVHQERVEAVFRLAGVGATCSLHCFHPESCHQPFSPECPSGLLAGLLLCPCSVLALSFLWPCSVFAVTLLWPCYDLTMSCTDLALSLIWSCPVLLWPCYDIAMTLPCPTLLWPCSVFVLTLLHFICFQSMPSAAGGSIPSLRPRLFLPHPASALHLWASQASQGSLQRCFTPDSTASFSMMLLVLYLSPSAPTTLTSFTFLQTSYHYLSSMYLSVYLLSIHLSSVYLSIYSSGFQRVGHNWATELNWTYLSNIYLSFMPLLSSVLEYICPKSSLLYPTKGWISRASNCAWNT